jgi:hypothetical protein
MNVLWTIHKYIDKHGSRHSSVGIVPGNWLDDRSSTSVKDKDFSLLHSVQISFGDHPASCPMGTGNKAIGGLVDDSASSCAEVKTGRAISALLHE